LVKTRLLIVELPEKLATRGEKEMPRTYRTATFSRHEASPGVENYDLTPFVDFDSEFQRENSPAMDSVLFDNLPDIPLLRIPDADNEEGHVTAPAGAIPDKEQAAKTVGKGKKGEVQERALADELQAKLKAILSGGKDDTYWLALSQMPTHSAQSTYEDAGLANYPATSSRFSSDDPSVFDSNPRSSTFWSGTTHVTSAGSVSDNFRERLDFRKRDEIPGHTSRSLFPSEQNKTSSSGLMPAPKQQNVSHYHDHGVQSLY
jgi:hypothetical protein